MPTVKITFWGTRGSYPISRKNSTFSGGNTSCVSIEANDKLIILDAGTGLIRLGESNLIRQYTSATLLLSHLHHDHIFGLPFFKPIWDQSFAINFYCGIGTAYGGLKKALETCFSPPYFPVPWSNFPAKISYYDFLPGNSFNIAENLSIQTVALDHPGGGCGFRINSNSKSIVYLTDTIHSQKTEKSFINFCKEAELLIYDATFTPDQFHHHQHWGHSTWLAATDLAKAATVKKLALFHHHPNHTDNDLTEILAQASTKFPETFLAIDELSLTM